MSRPTGPNEDLTMLAIVWAARTGTKADAAKSGECQVD